MSVRDEGFSNRFRILLPVALVDVVVVVCCGAAVDEDMTSSGSGGLPTSWRALKPRMALAVLTVSLQHIAAHSPPLAAAVAANAAAACFDEGIEEDHADAGDGGGGGGGVEDET